MPSQRPEPARKRTPAKRQPTAAEQQDEPAAEQQDEQADAPEPVVPTSLSREQQARLRQKLAAKFH
jgi:hypothetical protein